MQKDVFELSFYKITIEYWKKGYRSVTVLSFLPTRNKSVWGEGAERRAFAEVMKYFKHIFILMDNETFSKNFWWLAKCFLCS